MLPDKCIIGSNSSLDSVHLSKNENKDNDSSDECDNLETLDSEFIQKEVCKMSSDMKKLLRDVEELKSSVYNLVIRI